MGGEDLQLYSGELLTGVALFYWKKWRLSDVLVLFFLIS